jgi:inner membrane transporter RhtA
VWRPSYGCSIAPDALQECGFAAELLGRKLQPLTTIGDVAAEQTALADRGVLARAPSGALVVTAIASVQVGGALAVHLFTRVGPGGAVVLRLGTAAIVLAALWRPRLRHRSAHDIALAATFGFVLAAMNFSFYLALHRIPLGIAVALEFIGPLSVGIAGSRRWIDLLWVALAAGGILALTRGSAHGLNTAGVGFALLAGAFWAAYILLSARIGRTFERGTGLALAMLCATVFALPVGIAAAGTHLFELQALALGAAIGMLSSAIPYSLELEALRRIDPHVFGVLMSLEPAMAALAGFVLLGQQLEARELLGIALVVAASVGASRPAPPAPLDV